MAATTLEPRTEAERWRLDELRNLGFNRAQAEDLMQHPDIGHAARDLIDRGCLPRLAYRILRH